MKFNNISNDIIINCLFDYLDNYNIFKLIDKNIFNLIDKKNLKSHIATVYSWRTRPNTFKFLYIYKNKFKDTIYGFKESRSDVEYELYNKYSISYQYHLSNKKNLFLYAKKSFIKGWNIYDDKNNLLCYLKKKTEVFNTVTCYNIYRKNMNLWFSVNLRTSHLKPRKISIENINNNIYENGSDMEKNLVLNNLYPELVLTNTIRRKEKKYILKYKKLSIQKCSSKNCIIDYNDENILEFGKNSDNFYLLGYKKPLHGLFSFAISLVQIIT